MRVERALLEELPEKKFNIGYQGEQNHTQVIISCPIMFRDYPDAVASMVVKPPQGDLYPVSLTRDGNDLTWDVSDADVAIPGEGILQLTFTDGEGEEAEIIKTVYGAYSVNASLVANGEAPDPVQSWLDEAGAALATFENEIGDIRKITTATEEDEGLALSPKTVVNGKVTEWEYIDLADPEVVTQAIDDWLDDHPEATTTVEDGAITEAKLNDSLKADLAWQDDVDELKSAITLSNNLVDFENMEWVDGVYINDANGAEVSYGTWKASPYIELDGSKEYAMLYENDNGKLGTFSGQVYYAWYDASKVYLTGGHTGSVLTYHNSNAKYLRVSMGKVQSKNLVLNLSSVVSEMVGESPSIIIPYGHIKINNEVNIEALDARVANLEEHQSYELPSTWESKLESLRIAKGTKFTFGIQTDTHYTIVNDDVNFGNDIKTITKSVGVDFIANLGDIIRGYSTADVDDTTHTRASYTEIMKRYVDGVCCPFLFSVGNHDKNTMWADSVSDPSAIIGLDEIYSRTLALSNNTIKKFSSDGRSLYYYIDFDDAEIRAIVLNTTDASGNTNFYISQEQCDWFASKALDTDYSVIVLGHAPLEGTADYMVYNNVTNGTVIMSALRTFKSNGGEVIGCFWGHTHAQVSETVNGILHVAFTYRDTAEFVMIDKSNKSISTIGFGGAVDRSFTWS